MIIPFRGMRITQDGAQEPILRNNNPMSFIGEYPLYTQGSTSTSQLQSTISAATSGVGVLPNGVSHHPITCQTNLQFDENGVFSCEHFDVPPDDMRTQAGLHHSIAILIVEEAFKFTGMKELPYSRYEL